MAALDHESFVTIARLCFLCTIAISPLITSFVMPLTNRSALALRATDILSDCMLVKFLIPVT
jgi:hypothetical protein